MKIVDTFWLRAVSGTYIAVPLSGKAREMSCIVNLNESGALLFRRLIEGASREELVQALLDTYDIVPAAAEGTVDRFVRRLSESSLLQ